MDDVVLTPREKRQLLTVLRELDPAAPAEKRQHVRRKVLMALHIQKVTPRSKLTKLRATLVNVSARGVGLAASHRLIKGDKFILPLQFHEGGGWLVLCEVRNCVALPDGRFKLGGRFIDKIDDPHGVAKPPLDWLL